MISEITAYILNAFGIDRSGGNPAGVVLNAENLTTLQMLSISKKLGFSETVFVGDSETCDFRLRFFTPSAEVDLCGHATIAAYSLMFQMGSISPGTYKQELNAGKLEICVGEDGQVFMDQALPIFGDTIAPGKAATILGICEKDIIQTALPVQIVSTGMRDILVPVFSHETLSSIKPDFKKMAQFNKETSTIGFHVFYIAENGSSPLIYCRNFAPLFEIDEEAATGSSCGALGCYLFRYWRKMDRYRFLQGHSMDKPSMIITNIKENDGKISKVVVSGYGRVQSEVVVKM